MACAYDIYWQELYTHLSIVSIRWHYWK